MEVLRVSALVFLTRDHRVCLIINSSGFVVFIVGQVEWHLGWGRLEAIDRFCNGLLALG